MQSLTSNSIGRVGQEMPLLTASIQRMAPVSNNYQGPHHGLPPRPPKGSQSPEAGPDCIPPPRADPGISEHLLALELGGLRYLPTTFKLAPQLVEEGSEKNGTESPPLETNPKWYA
jgi:hypothetical protein